MTQKICETIQMMYMEYHDGERKELDSSVQAHINSCVNCQAWVDYMNTEQMIPTKIVLPERKFHPDSLTMFLKPQTWSRPVWAISFISIFLVGLAIGIVLMNKLDTRPYPEKFSTSNVEGISIELIPRTLIEDPVESPPDYIEQSGLWWQPEELEKLSSLRDDFNKVSNYWIHFSNRHKIFQA